MFFVELRDKDKNLNGIQVHKLKKKLGTKQLPTAELLLSGTKAQLVGQPGKGIKFGFLSNFIFFSRQDHDGTDLAPLVPREKYLSLFDFSLNSKYLSG